MPVTTIYNPVAKKRYTYQDYLQTPEGNLYELLNGNLVMSPSPYTKHQVVSMELTLLLGTFVKQKKLGKIFDAPTDVYFDDDNCVQPDLLYIANEHSHIITEKNIKGVPDLIIEIVSPSSVHRDTVEKKQLYARFGVNEFWLVYPDEKIIEIYVIKKNNYILGKCFMQGDILESPLFKGLKIKLEEVF